MKDKEELIKELEEIGIIGAIGDAISIQDTNYKILYQNQASKDFIGDHVGKYCYEAFERREQVCEDCPLAASFKDGKSHTTERSATTDKGIEYFEFTASPLRGLTGKIIAGIKVARNITKRKQAEETLRESEERFRGLIDATFEGVIIYEGDKIRDVNQSFAKMFEYELTEIIGKSASEFVTPESYKLVKNNIQRGYEKVYEIQGVKKNGTTFELEVIGKNCLYKGRSARVTAMRDITKRKQAEEALQKAHDELEERVKERTTELKETNNALKVLLKQFKNDKKDVEENILSNIKHLILPYIAKLKKRKSMTKDIAYLNVLESNLKEIISPFSQRLSSKYLSLTPQEIKVADFIKDGIHDKDMAEILNIAVETVKSHRQNIRKKLGIYSKRVNLRTQLLSLTK